MARLGSAVLGDADILEFLTLPLHEQEIQSIRLTNAEYRQNRVCLATMMCLVIEQMRKNLSAALFLRSSIQRPIGPRLFQLRVREAFDVGDDPLILLLSCSRQRREVIKNNCI